MKARSFLPLRRSLALFAAAVLLSPAILAAAPPEKPARPAAPATASDTSPVPRSVFVVPTSPTEGRDPFFPARLANAGAAPAKKSTKPVYSASA